jgi:hypothetical protein
MGCPEVWGCGESRSSENRTDENAAAIRRAQYLLSAAQAGQGFAVGGLVGYPVAAGVMRYRPTRPDVAGAEQEVMRLNRLARAEEEQRTLDQMRRDRTYNIPETTPIPQGGAHYVAPAGNVMLRRGQNGQWYDERGARTDRRPGRGWRRITELEADSGTAVG